MNKGEGKVFNFGPFRLDVSNRLLFCENEQLHLTNHEFIILLALVENNQQFISHNELMEKIWPGLQPPLSSLYAIIAKLRKILGSDGKSYIESKIWYWLFDVFTRRVTLFLPGWYIFARVVLHLDRCRASTENPAISTLRKLRSTVDRGDQGVLFAFLIVRGIIKDALAFFIVRVG